MDNTEDVIGMDRRVELKLCRICLNKTAEISLFSTQDDTQYSTKIMRCVNVVVTEGDGLPDTICRACADELCTAYEFVNKCEASDRALRCTDLFNNVLSKPGPDIKHEEIKQEAPDEEPGDRSDDEQFSEFVFENSEQVKQSKSSNSKKQKRKYTKSLGFYENILRRMSHNVKTGPIKCPVCGYMANCKSALEGHMRTHTGEKPYSCETCGAQFNLKGTLKRHIINRHTQRERQFVCETCGTSFATKASIQCHLRVHTNEKPYTCGFCGKAFTQNASMIRHKRIHTGERPYTCCICSKTFTDKTHMKRHMVVHSDKKNFTCNVCNKAVKTRCALKAHMVIHSNEKHIICNYCGMAFSIKGNLMSHIRRVHSEKSGDCSICNKSFSDLETHTRKHTGEKPVVCKLCDQGFSSKRSLANHISFRHDNAGKFKCSIGECVKTFPTAVMLEFHVLKQHTNHTPFVCQHCSRGFYRVGDLSRHVKLSHTDKKRPVKSVS